ncbi:MAG TPA: hypothetical protein PLK99_07945, partial [Burkholderiales bacterium]|nr:hypothetical protein [Burkholderiales bacterium]
IPFRFSPLVADSCQASSITVFMTMLQSSKIWGNQGSPDSVSGCPKKAQKKGMREVVHYPCRVSCYPT